jgi:hypothetical protein
MPANTAEYLYEIAKQLPASERIRLVEKIAHGLASPPAPTPEPEASARVIDGLSTRMYLVGQVTDLALDPPRFIVRTARGPVVVDVAPHLLDSVRDAWGKEAIVGIDAVVDADGAVHNAVAVTVEPTLDAEDPLAIFESTFGTGAEIWSTTEGREQLEEMRGNS